MFKKIFLKAIVLALGLACLKIQALPQFSYEHSTEFAYNGQPGFQINPDLEVLAKFLYPDMGKSVLFDSTLIRDPEATRNYHLKEKHISSHNGKMFTVRTQDGVPIDCTFFDRSSDTLLIVGEGFTNEREVVTPFIDMFPNYDVVLFDFRGHGYESTDTAWDSGEDAPDTIASNFGCIATGFALGSVAALVSQRYGGTSDSPAASAIIGAGVGALTGYGSYRYKLFNRVTNVLVKKGFGVNPGRITFGEKEHLDVIAVVEGFKKMKQDRAASQPSYCQPYKNVFGLGLCYSALIFLKTAAEKPGLFDKIVLDGCWLSLPLFVDKLKKDLMAIPNPQTGGCANHWFFGRPDVQENVEWIARNIVALRLNDLSLLPYAPLVKNTSLLFIHCKDDYMIRRHEFEQLWNALTGVEKNVVLTSNTHVRNHLKQKELYKLICDLYFQFPQETMVRYLSNKNELVEHFKHKLDQFVDPRLDNKENSKLGAAAA